MGCLRRHVAHTLGGGARDDGTARRVAKEATRAENRGKRPVLIGWGSQVARPDPGSGSGGLTAIGTAASGDVAAADVQHDARHAAGTILLLVEALRSRVDGLPDAPIELDAIAECASAISMMMDAAAQRTPTRVDLTAHRVVLETRSVFSGGVRIETRRATVFAQPSEVRRLVANLVQNACRAAGPSGRVLVQVAATSRLIILSVDDNGPGFQDGRHRDGRHRDGRGLAIVSRIVSDLGGEISFARSKQLGGASVLVTLPAAPQ